MSRSSIITIISIVIVTVIGALVFSSEQTRVPSDQPTSSPATSTDSDVVRTINGLHQYQPEADRHIVAGTTTVPTPCHQLQTDVTIRESAPQQVVIDFAAEKANPDAVCAQQIQETRFKAVFTAQEGADIQGGTFNGDQIRLNLQEVKADQDLEDFQIYSKG